MGSLAIELSRAFEMRSLGPRVNDHHGKLVLCMEARMARHGLSQACQ